jgi:hypothetical protein
MKKKIKSVIKSLLEYTINAMIDEKGRRAAIKAMRQERDGRNK